MSEQHVLYEPEWVIESSGTGSFQVECECGWLGSGFDTASLARAAGFAHATGKTATPADHAATEGPSGNPQPARRWWQRR